jgi:hypothetical protein
MFLNMGFHKWKEACTMRTISPAFLLVALAACGPEYAVVPYAGQPQVVAGSPVGLTLTALANQWDATPIDLADYLTPIAVELSNAGPYEVRVSYADFALRDEHGVRRPAVNPFLPTLSRRSAFEGQTLLAARGGGGGGHGGGAHMGGGYHGGGHWGGGYYGGARRGYGVYGGGWSGFRVYGGLRHYYGPRGFYWYGAGFYPPYYSDWVFWWGPRYYPVGPSEDVLALALPEGVLSPGGHVTGFLYFEKATGGGAHSLDLGWEMHEAQHGTSLGSTHVPLQILHR